MELFSYKEIFSPLLLPKQGRVFFASLIFLMFF